MVDTRDLIVIDDDEHSYLSTACLHGRHLACRETCKFCAAMCVCFCHEDERERYR